MVNLTGLNPIFAARLSAAVAAAEQATGAKADYISGRRTAAQGVDIWNRATGNGRHAPSFPAAPPGKSLHEQGMAIDLGAGPVRDWIQAHAKTYGLEPANAKRGFGWDAPHIQLARATLTTPYDSTPSAFAGADKTSPAVDAVNAMASGQSTPTLGKRSRGPAVRELQSQLAAAGLYKGKIDGQYGPETAAAVRGAEVAYGLTRDKGVAGPQVQAALAGTGRTQDITSALALAPPGGPAGPVASPLDIAFGRASALPPQDVASMGTPPPMGAGRPVKTESIGPPTIPGSPPPMGSGLPASVYEIAGSGGLTSGGPPSQMPGAPFDLSGGSLIAGGGVPGASATMGWNQAPESGVPVAAAHPYHGQRGGPYGETGSRFTPAGRTAAMRNSLAREADAAHFGPSLGDVSRTGRYVPGDTISMMSNLAAGFGRPADFSFRPDLRPEVPRTPDAIDEAAAAPLPADEGAPLFGGKPIGGPLSGVVPLGTLLQSPSSGDPYAANRAYAAAHPPPTFFAGPGSGALSPPGDVPRFDVSRFASEPNSGGMAPVDRGTSINDVLAGIAGIPGAIFGPGGPVMSASQWLTSDAPAAATPAAPVGRSIPMSQSPFAMPQPWNGSGEPNTLDQLHSLMPFSGSGGDNYLGGAPREDRLAGVPLSAPKSDFGPAGGAPAISAAPLTPGGPGYTTIDMSKLGNGVFDMSAAPIYTPPRPVSIAGAPADQARKALAAAAGQAAAARPAAASAPWTSPSANPSYGAGASYNPFSSPATISAISNYLGGHGVTPGGYVGYTPPGYTAPSFDPVSGGSIYAYQSNGQGGGTYVDSHGTVHSY